MDIFARLREKFPCVRLERDFSFAKHTTVGCGGTASVAVCPANTEELAQILRFLHREEIPLCFLGAGANVLPADGHFDGAVVRFVRFNSLSAGDGELFAGAGVTGSALLRFARENLIGGFEPFTGIPATVGGGVAMNAGVSARHFADLTLRVLSVENGTVKTIPASDCAFGEKDSVFLGGIAIAGVYFRAAKSFSEQIERETCYYRIKREKLPKGRSMGCTFVNPAGDSAGRLIDACGLKGLRIGGAYVSREHANFIINEGGSASDIARLIDVMKAEVFRQTGVLLREEIRRLP